MKPLDPLPRWSARTWLRVGIVLAGAAFLYVIYRVVSEP
jgi:hypothetical protein